MPLRFFVLCALGFLLPACSGEKAHPAVLSSTTGPANSTNSTAPSDASAAGDASADSLVDEEIQVDTFTATSPPASFATKKKLAFGATYTITVSGTWAAWSDWTNICIGTPDGAPQFPSTTQGAPTSPVGNDAEYSFAWVKESASLCPGGSPVGAPPQGVKGIEFRRSAGVGWETLPAVEKAMVTNHIYTYETPGLGQVLEARSADTTDPTNNNGLFKVRVVKK